ncbi:hypothetical protein PFISCL1PPCAC_28190, partial [Pristionchus fissidentatus]
SSTIMGEYKKLRREGSRPTICRYIAITVLLVGSICFTVAAICGVFASHKRQQSFGDVSLAVREDIDDNAIEYQAKWSVPRTYKQLEAEKYDAEDAELEADVTDGGRFGFIPYHVSHMLEDYKRITLRLEFNVTIGRTMDRVFVEIFEVNKTRAEVPFTRFHYNNLMPMSGNHRRVDIPIAKKYMQKWMSKPFAMIEFVYKIEFGMFSNVKNITLKRPVLIFSRTAPPKKCSEFACCLTSNVHMFKNSPIYFNVIVPIGVHSQRCIDCARASEVPGPYMDEFNKVIHGQTTLEEIRPQPQMGMCRVTEWGAMPTMFWREPIGPDGKKGPIEVKTVEVPYFNARACECVEDYDVDYEEMLFANQGVKPRSKFPQ